MNIICLARGAEENGKLQVLTAVLMTIPVLWNIKTIICPLPPKK
jgi:hypothetical protein